MRRSLFLIVGWLAVGLGFIGLFLPVLPTTPFLLVAAYCFAHGSPRLHAWLMKQPRFGPILREWEQRRAIPRRGKLIALCSIVLSFTYVTFFKNVPLYAVVSMWSTGIVVLTYIFSRPDA